MICPLYKGKFGEVRTSSVIDFEGGFDPSNFISFKYVAQGKETYEVDKLIQTVRAGNAIFFDKGKSYFGSCTGPNLNIGFCIDLSPEIVNLHRLDLWGEERVVETTEYSPVFMYRPSSSVVQSILGIKQVDKMKIEESMNSFIEAYIHSQDSIVESMKAVPRVKESVKREVYRKLLTAQIFIHDSLMEPISLDDLACVSGISKFYFQRLFKTFFGLSPSQYLDKVRLERGISMLRETDIPVSTIAYESGFTDPAYFSRRFKKAYGMSPIKYRENEKSKIVQVAF